MGKSKYSVLAWASVAWIAAVFPATTRADDGLLKVSSPDLTEVDSYLFSKKASLHQSGERLIIDAAIFSVNQNENSIDLKKFAFAVPAELRGSRLCLDIAAKTTGFRRVSLMKLTKPVGEIVAHVEDSGTTALNGDGTTLVAFPTKAMSDNPLDACLTQDEWIYPARDMSSTDQAAKRMLRLFINTGGGHAKLVQLMDTGAAIGLPKFCVDDGKSKGLYDQICEIQLSPTAQFYTTLRLSVSRTNSKSLIKYFKVATSVDPG